MANVRISQLNGFTNIIGEDFIALVDSSSLTTYRSSVTSLVGYFAVSGSVLSSSWSSASISASFSSNSISASYARTASFLNYPNISTASAAISSSYSLSTLSASYARSASAANSASFSTSNLSSSYAMSASNADTASYVNFAINIPSFASSSISSSWASSSLSSSTSVSASHALQADTASFLTGVQNMPFMPKAWASVLIPTASTNYSTDNIATVNNGNVVNKPIIINSYNVSDVKWATRTQVPVAPWNFGKAVSGTGTLKESMNFVITMPTASNSLLYCVMGIAAETGDLTTETGDWSTCTFYPLGMRTSTQFTCSLRRLENSVNPQFDWFQFVVYA